MAHFAKIDDEGLVLTVLAVNDSDALTEAAGQAHLETHNNWPANKWIQTSYNTRCGKYHIKGTKTIIDQNNQEITVEDYKEGPDQSKAFRGNYAGIGYTWDSVNQLFFPPKSEASFVKDLTTGLWEPPIAYPTVIAYGESNTFYVIHWDESNIRWMAYDREDPKNLFIWNTDTSSWDAS